MGRWEKGQSGNPKGRPKATYNNADTLRALMGTDAPAIIRKLVELALGGDVNAARLVLERLVPAIKAAELPVALALPADADLADQGRSVIAVLAAGQIPPGQAASILQALAGVARLVELTELEKRIAALESPPCTPDC